MSDLPLDVRKIGKGRCSGEESPGSVSTTSQITSGGGDLRESAAENIPPLYTFRAVRVKWCGKSAPPIW